MILESKLSLGLTLGLLGALPAFSQGEAARAPEEPGAWDRLAAEYEAVFVPWAQEMMRTGGWSDAVGVRPSSPELEFWPRFEALASRGEGRAVLWLLQNAPGEGEERAARLRPLLALVREAGEAEWVGAALHVLAKESSAFETAELVAYVESMTAPAHPAGLRATALVARAALCSENERPHAAERLLRAAFLRWREVELAPGDQVLPVDAQDVAEEALVDLEQDHRAWWDACFQEGDDGVYYSRAAFRPDPRESWEPVLEVLAEQGASAARVWLLFEGRSRGPLDLERRRAHLEALSQETLAPETLEELGWNLASLMSELGADFVEPRVRRLVEQAPEELRPRLLYGMGDGLCKSASDEAQRERGLALLREVQTRWPESQEGTSAAGKLFRYTNLVLGKPVPDFETVDAEGNAFKLSDYAGKVTVLDFWGFW